MRAFVEAAKSHGYNMFDKVIDGTSAVLGDSGNSLSGMLPIFACIINGCMCRYR